MSNDLSAQLRAHLQGQPQASTAKSEVPEYLALISEITGEDTEELLPDRRLADVGLTSLNMIEFAVRAEDRLGVVFEESDAQALETLDDVAKFVEAHQ
ncbi:MAG: acyl carrier protein [Corynebacterium casei]|nr:acyl carrier protein [Corynebacterium casei]